jgi:hypothetical protein
MTKAYLKERLPYLFEAYGFLPLQNFLLGSARDILKHSLEQVFECLLESISLLHTIQNTIFLTRFTITFSATISFTF